MANLLPAINHQVANEPVIGKESIKQMFKIELPPEQREELLKALKVRFEKNMNRHKDLEWAKVQAKLEANTKKSSRHTETVCLIERVFLFWIHHKT